MNEWVLLCRAGYERDCAAEALGGAERIPGAAVFRRGDGHLRVSRNAREPGLPEMVWSDLVFARQVFAVEGELPPLVDPADLLAAVLERLSTSAVRFADVLVEAPDTDTGRSLWPACRRIAEGLKGELDASGRLSPRNPGAPRLHVFLAEGRRPVVGSSSVERSSAWAMGIPRLRVPSRAPSRSSWKLEEAIHVFLTDAEQAARLRPGLRAVDLGAAPGGWTWQLARRGLRVTAVDNADLAPVAFETGLVEHVRADGYRYRPSRPVDWLVCDMVTAPARVAALVGGWFRSGLCREAFFNCKLPSGRGYEELCRSREILGRSLGGDALAYTLRFKHLYHDRDEITAHLYAQPRPGSRMSAARRAAPDSPRGRRGRRRGRERGRGTGKG